MTLSWAKTGVDSGYRLVAPIDVEIVVDDSRRWSLRVDDREPVRLGRRASFDDAESKLIVYDLVPSKPMLSEAELAPVRSLCEAAGFPT